MKHAAQPNKNTLQRSLTLSFGVWLAIALGLSAVYAQQEALIRAAFAFYAISIVKVAAVYTAGSALVIGSFKSFGVAYLEAHQPVIVTVTLIATAITHLRFWTTSVWDMQSRTPVSVPILTKLTTHVTTIVAVAVFVMSWFSVSYNLNKVSWLGTAITAIPLFLLTSILQHKLTQEDWIFKARHKRGFNDKLSVFIALAITAVSSVGIVAAHPDIVVPPITLVPMVPVVIGAAAGVLLSIFALPRFVPELVFTPAVSEPLALAS